MHDNSTGNAEYVKLGVQMRGDHGHGMYAYTVASTCNKYLILTNYVISS